MKITKFKFQASPDSGDVSGILMKPADAQWLLVFAHGAGTGMHHPFMETMAKKLGEQGVGTLRYQFPYMEQKKKRPDSRAVLLATVESAVNAARKVVKDTPLLAGGKSMGGRMTSNAAAEGLLPDVCGIVFFGFPLHPPNQPEKWKERAGHLEDVEIPMLFLQGTRDAFADLKLLQPVCKRLGKRATLHLIEGGDHSFHLPKGSGRTDSEILDGLAKTVVKWCEGIKA